MADLPTLRGERVTLRPALEADVPALAALLGEPSVAAWWGRYDEERVRAELAGTWTISAARAVAGWLQAHEETDPDYPSVAFDIAVAEPLHGRGLGPEALQLAIDWFARERGHHRFTIDPSVENEHAIRAYEAVGFRRVGVLRRYERAPDGHWRDGLLMELVL